MDLVGTGLVYKMMGRSGMKVQCNGLDQGWGWLQAAGNMVRWGNVVLKLERTSVQKDMCSEAVRRRTSREMRWGCLAFNRCD